MPLSLRERVLEICHQLETAPSLRERVRPIVERLAEPMLRIAIGGRVSSGKSTLVNSLLGQRLAATGALETTRVVAWYEFGVPNETIVYPLDGLRYAVEVPPGGGLPTAAGALRLGIADIHHVLVRVSNTVLSDRHSFIDTPGLAALSGLDALSVDAMAKADAVLYVMPHAGQHDREVLQQIRDWMPGAGLTSLSVIGVVSQVDRLADNTGDPWPNAHRVAQAYAEQLRGYVAEVIPVAGLLAQTTRCAGFTEEDMRGLRFLAEFPDRDERDFALRSADAFRDWRHWPYGKERRERLIAELDLYGIRCAVAFLGEGRRGTDALMRALDEASGMAVLERRIQEVFLKGADRLRAARAVAQLGLLGRTGATAAETAALTRMHEELAALQRLPAMLQVRLSAALCDGTVWPHGLAESEVADLTALAHAPGPAEALGLPPDADDAAFFAAADAQVDRWRRVAGTNRAASRLVDPAVTLCTAWLLERTP